MQTLVTWHTCIENVCQIVRCIENKIKLSFDTVEFIVSNMSVYATSASPDLRTLSRDNQCYRAWRHRHRPLNPEGLTYIYLYEAGSEPTLRARYQGDRIVLLGGRKTVVGPITT